MNWHRTDTGLENELFKIERIVDRHMFTKQMKVWGYTLIDKRTGEKWSNGTMKDAKAWAEYIL